MITKKNILVIGIIFLTFQSNSQSFQQGGIYGSIGTGIGIYGGSSNVPDISGTAAVLVPIELEYGLSDQFGLGLTYQYGSYVSNDSISESARTHNIGVMGYYHFSIKEKSNLFLKAGIGYSNFKYQRTDSGEEVFVIGSGPWIDLGFGWRHMIQGGPIGYFLYVDYSIMPLGNFEIDNEISWEYQGEKVRITYQGVDIKVGLVFRFN